MPFNWKTPLGYSVAWFGQAFGWTVTASVAFSVYCFSFGSNLHFIFIAEDITKDLVDFNSIVKTPNANREELMERFCTVIQLYSYVKE